MIAIADGRPWPLGATFDGGGVNFALFSAHAERVVLCLFAPGGQEIGRIDLPALTDEVWHGYVEGLMPGQLYGYRVHGAYEPEAGHRFNPAKLLLDPYAKKIVGPLRNSLALMGYRVGSGKEEDSPSTAGTAPLPCRSPRWSIRASPGGMIARPRYPGPRQ
jgi:glycogen operon protein